MPSQQKLISLKQSLLLAFAGYGNWSVVVTNLVHRFSKIVSSGSVAYAVHCK